MDSNWDEIIEGCLREERSAQHKLYQAYFSYGMSVCIRYCRDRDEAVAVLHDAFLTIFKRLERFDRSAPFKPWFRVIVVRAALDHIRRQQKHSHVVELEDHINPAGREDTLSRIGYEELLAMVQKLSHAYKTVFNLYVLDGFKHEEIAEALGISIGTSKSNLSKARAHLQRMVQASLVAGPTPSTS